MAVTETLPMGFRRSLQALRGTPAVELVASAVVAVLAIGTFAVSEPLGFVGPRTVAVRYLDALASGDASKAAGLSSVKAAAGGSENASLLDRRALAAQLAHGGRPAGRYQLTSQTVAGSTVTIGLDRSDGGKTNHSQLILTSDLPFLRLHPEWRVLVAPAMLVVKTPAGVGNPTIDGIPTKAAGGGTVTLSVLPGHHVLGASGGTLLEAIEQPIEVASNGSLTATVQSRLTSAGQTAAAMAVRQAFDRCMALTGVPVGCPQRFFAQEIDLTDATWKLVGDPSKTLTYSTDQSGSVMARGSFQAVANGVFPFGRGFQIPLTATGDKLQAGAFSPVSVTFARPAAATDAAIIEGVRTALLACAASTDANPINCPQITFGSITGSLAWVLIGDPVADTSISFDSTNGVLTVRGSVRMQATYDENLLGATVHHGSASTYHYTWTGLWEDSKVVFYTHART